MSGTHEDCWELLPWYVNGTIEPDRRSEIEQHLRACPECRRELSHLKVLRQSIADTVPPVGSAEAGLEKVLTRIQTESLARARRRPYVGWLIAAQAAAIAVLSVLVLWQPHRPAEPYRTLSEDTRSAVPSGDVLRVVFRETATEKQIRRLLHSVNAEIVGGPSAVGAYTLRASSRSEVLIRLRSDPAVRMAEIVSSSTGSKTDARLSDMGNRGRNESPRAARPTSPHGQ